MRVKKRDFAVWAAKPASGCYIDPVSAARDVCFDRFTRCCTLMRYLMVDLSIAAHSGRKTCIALMLPLTDREWRTDCREGMGGWFL